MKTPAILLLVCCVLSAGSVANAADDTKLAKAAVTTENLQSWMTPPRDWKVDFEVLDQYFWLIKPALGLRKDMVMIAPFWPAFISLDFDRDEKLRSHPEGFSGDGYAIEKNLKSENAATREATEIWLRQSLILYYAGFRLSHYHGKNTYAPWISREHEKQINGVVDEYIAQLKPMKVKTDGKEVPCLDETLFDLITTLKDKKRGTVLDFYGGYQTDASHIPALLVYPLYWLWRKEDDSSDMWAYRPWTNDNVSENYMFGLIGGTIPENKDNRARLWCRDVYLSYLAGKQLFENKSCPIEDGSKAAFLEAAIQGWWRAARVLQKKG